MDVLGSQINRDMEVSHGIGISPVILLSRSPPERLRAIHLKCAPQTIYKLEGIFPTRNSNLS